MNDKGTMRLVVSALAVCATLVLAGGASSSRGALPDGAAQVAAMLRGLPQHGTELGRPGAPVTLVEFADLQCPYCARWERDVLPAIVRRYVRTGKVRLVFSGMAFVGPDSLKALRTVLAAGLQDRLWNVTTLLYRNQGAENSGWVTDALIRRAGAVVDRLNVARMLAARASPAVDRQLRAAESLAASAGIRATPSLAVGRTGSSLHVLSAIDAAAISAELDALLRG